jgi:hypothetical protein
MSELYCYTSSGYIKFPTLDTSSIHHHSLNSVDKFKESPVIRVHDPAELKEISLSIGYAQSDFVSQINTERVASFLEYLTEEKILEIQEVSDNFKISIGYELYNKSGICIKKGTIAGNATPALYSVEDDISEDNELRYRNCYSFATRSIIDVPNTCRYGIKNPVKDNPYTLILTTLKVYTDTGEESYIDFTTEEEASDLSGIATGGVCANYYHNHPCCCHEHEAHSGFVTNAEQDTTIVDSMVVSKIIRTNPENTEVPILEIPLNIENIKICKELKFINLNIEILVDNFVQMYSSDAVTKILQDNAYTPPEEPAKPEKNPYNEPEVTVNLSEESLSETLESLNDLDENTVVILPNESIEEEITVAANATLVGDNAYIPQNFEQEI